MPNLIDYDIIKMLMTRSNYQHYSSLIDESVLFDETKKIIKAITTYYKEVDSSCEEINLIKFVPWFTNVLNKTWTSDEIQYYKNVFSTINDLPTDDIASTLQRFRSEKLKKDLNIAVAKDDITAIKALLEDYEKHRTVSEEKGYISNDHDTAFKLATRENGLKFRLKGLNMRLKPLVKGDAGIVFAYTNTGKSAFIVSESSFMAQQLAGDQKVLYFNNEGSEDRIVRGFRCATLKKTVDILVAHPERATEEYIKKMHGDLDRVLIFDVLGKNTSYVEQQCEKYNPGLIIIDQLDNLIPSKQRETARPYQHVYEWARGLSKKYCPLISASQASGNAVYYDKDNHSKKYKRYLDETDLHWSRVDKQGACEFMIGIGADVDQPNLRFISIPRVKEQGTKLYRSGSTTFDCNFNGELMLYED
jgi:replicative DNA helicase